MPRRDASSDSDSDRSDYRRRNRKNKRRRRYSSSSESNNSSSDRKYYYKSSRSTSRSRSRSRERSRRRRSRSHSSSRKRGSRHNSPPLRRRSRSRSHSRSKPSRSSSRSDSRSHAKRTSRRSRSRSYSPYRQKSSSSQNFKLKEEDAIKLKLQQALKAAATADAELREKGLLPEPNQNQKPLSSVVVPSVADQIKRAQAIDEINAPSFIQHSFVSTHSVKQEKSNDSIGDCHLPSFGLSSFHAVSTDIPPSNPNISKAIRESWKEDPEKLAHENLFEDIDAKTERWRKKLMNLRRKKLNGDLTIM